MAELGRFTITIDHKLLCEFPHYLLKKINKYIKNETEKKEVDHEN